ncbi:MAG: hypothetical protein IJW76_05275 [Clostridia bacterium]|nr:hypothetical protein [Clostridia bacterium]
MLKNNKNRAQKGVFSCFFVFFFISTKKRSFSSRRSKTLSEQYKWELQRGSKKGNAKESKMRKRRGKCKENDKEIRVGERKEICVLEPIYGLSHSYPPINSFPSSFPKM